MELTWPQWLVLIAAILIYTPIILAVIVVMIWSFTYKEPPDGEPETTRLAREATEESRRAKHGPAPTEEQRI